MNHKEAVDLAVILQETLGVPGVWMAIVQGGHGDLIRDAGKRLQGCLFAHWQENGCSFDGGRNGMNFPETCEAATG